MDVYQRRRLVALSVIAAIFVIIVLLIRSCGDDEEAPLTAATGVSGVSGATGASGPVSQDDYISQADAICLQTNTTISNIDAADANEAASQTGDALASELDQLQSLPEPTDGQDQLKKFLNALEDQVAGYDDRDRAVDRGDEAAVGEIDATIDQADQKAQEAAEKFGFDACGDTSKTGGSTTAGGGGGAAPAETTTTAPETGGATAPAPVPTPTPPPVPTTPTTTTPVEPAPAPEAPAAPAPSEEGGAAPAPAPSGGQQTSPSGGVSP
jgi:hypothetical protein